MVTLEKFAPRYARMKQRNDVHVAWLRSARNCFAEVWPPLRYQIGSHIVLGPIGYALLSHSSQGFYLRPSNENAPIGEYKRWLVSVK